MSRPNTNQVVAVLTDLERGGYITGLTVAERALGNPALTDVMFELSGEPMLVMVADETAVHVRIVGARREVDVPLGDVKRALLDWTT